MSGAKFTTKHFINASKLKCTLLQPSSFVSEGGQRRAAGVPGVGVDVGGGSQLCSELRTEKQTGRLHKHNSQSHVDSSTDGGKISRVWI